MNVRSKTLLVIALLALSLTGLILARGGAFNPEAQPEKVITQAEEATSQKMGPNFTPRAGTRVLGPAVLDKARASLASMTAKDPVKVLFAAFGRDTPEDVELHLQIKNEGACEVTSVSGVAYGYDARGRPSRVNGAGENYLAFARDGLSVPPGGQDLVAAGVKRIVTASIAIGHVDEYTCKDGSKHVVRGH